MNVRRQGIHVPRTESEAEAAEVAREILVDGAQKVGQRFTHPDADWAPIWLVLTQTQGTVISADRRVPNDPDGKRAVTLYVADFARKRGAVAIGSLMSTWQVELDERDVGRERAEEIHRRVLAQNGSTEGIAERVERLAIFVYTAGNLDAYMAPITRHDDAPPTLGPFEERRADFLEGRMSEPLQDALRRVG